MMIKISKHIRKLTKELFGSDLSNCNNCEEKDCPIRK